jgi:ribonuclease HII
MDLLVYEHELWSGGYKVIAGVDEAGRGPLAGPVVAAAVIFPQWQKYIAEINDSKKLSSTKRKELKPIIENQAMGVGVGLVDENEIDHLNILQATYKAMTLAINNLCLTPDFLLIDGRGAPVNNIPLRCIIHGDGLSMSIAAASIIAKETRDRIMLEYDRLYPHYGFAQHKGYPTSQHLQALRRYGRCPIHRRTFKPRALRDLYG